MNNDNGRNSGQTGPLADGSGQVVDAQLLSGSVIIDQTLKVTEVYGASKSDQHKEISENDLLSSKKRDTCEGANCQSEKPVPPELPKIRKTVSGSLSENDALDWRWLLAVQAYHSNVQEERSSRTAGCSAYPAKDSHLVEQSCEEVKENFDEELQPQGRYGLISLFDGVSSVVPLLKKKIGYAPVVVILAENITEYGHLYALNLDIGQMKNGVM